jgi:hypothetical protein
MVCGGTQPIEFRQLVPPTSSLHTKVMSGRKWIEAGCPGQAEWIRTKP